MKNLIFAAALLFLFASCTTLKRSVKERASSRIMKFDIAYDQELSDQYLSGLPITPGSGLAFLSEDAGKFELIGLGDKGPKAKQEAKKSWDGGRDFGDEFYLLEDYQPFMARIAVDESGAKIQDLVPLKDSKGFPVTGPYETRGIDARELAIDAEGVSVESEEFVWLAEENFPSLHKVNLETGMVVESLFPGRGLPELLSRRRFNRGFEAVSRFPDGRLLASLQSTFADAGAAAKRLVTFVEVDPKTKRSTVHTLEIPSDFDDPRHYKVGAGEFLDGEDFLFIEQGKTSAGYVNRIVKLSLNKSQSISRVLVFDLRQHGWNEKKAEGLSVSPSKKFVAISSDNDFGVRSEPAADGGWVDSERRSQLWLIPIEELELG